MDDEVYAGVLSADALQAAVDALRPQALYGIVESLTEIGFPPPHQQPLDVKTWPKGRIFCKAFELRWERIGNCYRTVFAGENGWEPPGGLAAQALEVHSKESTEYYCWKECDPRLGRTLDYRCVPGNGDVKLVVREYRDDYGRLVFWRYIEMKREGAGDESL
jgi:hypothetical protein